MVETLYSPTLSFTIPSLHDSTALDCRVYHPASLAPSPRAPPWRRHAAIIAHPYAPMGGSYDDPVVHTVAAKLLRLGYLVATFNFRGVGASTGRTSWTAKAEKADYMSVAGFVSYYVHHLDPFSGRGASPPHSAKDESHPSPIPRPSPTKTHTQAEQTPVLLLGGYSYGAMITTLLPPLPDILRPLAEPRTGSPAAEIRLRAQHLAESQNTVLSSARAAALEKQKGGGRSSHRTSLGLGVRVGGDEDVRRSHDSRRSFSLDAEEKIRRGVSELVARGKRWHGKSAGDRAAAAGNMLWGPEEEDEEHHLPALSDLERPHVAYLMVSPPIGFVTSLATMSFSVPFLGRHKNKAGSSDKEGSNGGVMVDRSGEKGVATSSADTAEQKLADSPSLVVYGGSDSLLSERKTREWVARLQSVSRSRFRALEVPNAGHFWTEGSTLHEMEDAVGVFAEELLRGET